MHIQINAGDVRVSDAINDRVNQEVEDAMERFVGRVTRVEVHLKDHNGRKAGLDMRCLMEARIAGHQPVAVEHEAHDLYDAITAAAGKLERAVRRRIERIHDKRMTA